MSMPTPNPPTQRSSFVTTLAWITIVPAALGVVISTLQNILFFTVMPMDPQSLPSVPDMEQMPAFVTFMLAHLRAMFVAFWLMTVVSLVSGIGLLRRKEWARLFFIALMGLSIVWNMAGVYLQQSFFSAIPSMAEAPPEFSAQFESMASTMWVVSIAMAVAFSAVSVWLIWRLSSAPIKAEFGATS
jgi:hypothetical protein